eukprot:3261207-Pyramimonas_sp.AAC.1
MRARPRSCRLARRCPARVLWIGAGARPVPPRCWGPRAPAGVARLRLLFQGSARWGEGLYCIAAPVQPTCCGRVRCGCCIGD